MLETPIRNASSTHVFHQYTLKVKDGRRDELKAYLQEQGIPSMIYYPIPLHKQNAYIDYDPNLHLPITEKLSEEVISLPIHTEMNKEQLEHITQIVKNFFA